jgi:hypothetical protein
LVVGYSVSVIKFDVGGSGLTSHIICLSYWGSALHLFLQAFVPNPSPAIRLASEMDPGESLARLGDVYDGRTTPG